jgi:hypothetical protein
LLAGVAVGYAEGQGVVFVAFAAEGVVAVMLDQFAIAVGYTKLCSFQRTMVSIVCCRCLFTILREAGDYYISAGKFNHSIN